MTDQPNTQPMTPADALAALKALVDAQERTTDGEWKSCGCGNCGHVRTNCGDDSKYVADMKPGHLWEDAHDPLPWEEWNANEGFAVLAHNTKLAEIAATMERMRETIVKLSIPVTALLMDRESEKYITPAIWRAMGEAVTEASKAI